MRIESLQRNVSYSNTKSLVGQYFRVLQSDGSKAATPAASSLQFASPQDLKSQLVNVANKLKIFRDSDSLIKPQDLRTSGASSAGSSSTTDASQTDGTEETSEASDPSVPPPAPQSNAVSFSLENANKPVKFGRQLLRAFRRGTKEEDGELLQSKNLQGDVKFKIGEGDSAQSFSIHVDGNTTAQQFVDEFNSKSGGRAQASLVETSREDGKSRFRIKIESQATPPPPPPAEQPEGSEPPATPPSTQSQFLGSGQLDISALRADAGDAINGLKSFVDAFNKLVRFSRDGNKEGDILASTGVDEQAIGALRDAIVGSNSKDGSVSFAQFVTERGNGELQFNSREFERVFAEDPEGAAEAIQKLATDVTGSDGIVRGFVQSGALVDQAFQSIQVQAAQTAIQQLDDKSISQLQDARALEARSDKVINALEDKVGFLQGLKR